MKGRKAWAGGNRDRSDVATSPGTPGASGWVRQEGSSPQASRGVCLLTPQFQTPGHQKWESMAFSVVIPPVRGHGLWQPQETNAHPTFYFPLGSLSMCCPHCSHEEGRTCVCCSQTEPSAHDRDSSRPAPGAGVPESPSGVLEAAACRAQAQPHQEAALGCAEVGNGVCFNLHYLGV